MGTREDLIKITGSPFWDATWYEINCMGAKKNGLQPSMHFLLHGGPSGKDPGPNFDSQKYLAEHPDLAGRKIIPLLHFIDSQSADKATWKPTRLNIKTDNIKRRFEFGAGIMMLRTVSVIIPTIFKDWDLLNKCLQSLRGQIVVEILVIDNRPETKDELAGSPVPLPYRIIHAPGEFNWSRLNNIGAKEAVGDFLLFLNDDLYSPDLSESWVLTLVSAFENPKVNIAAPVLLNPNRTIQSAGCYRTAEGCTVAHSRIMPTTENHAVFVEAVVGAAMMFRREAFQPFDESLKVLLADSEICLRLGGCIIVPEAQLIHHERTSRGPDGPQAKQDEERFKSLYPMQQSDLLRSNLVWDCSIKRVLIIKLDHIGDFSISLEAVRDMKRSMQNAKFDLVCGPWLVDLATSTEMFDRVFPLKFFKADASAGIVPTLDAKDLRDFIRSKSYDFAIDLRAAPESRIILKEMDDLAITVGFESPYYTPDISLPYACSRTTIGGGHNSDDLKHLVAWLPVISGYPRLSPASMGKTVGFHIGASSDVKRWTKWKQLCDLLVAHGYDLVQFGMPGDELVTRDALDMRGASDLAGFSKMVDENCAIYLGHDTGTTHIVAAQRGIPVIEIVSGLVDPAEWQARGEFVSSLWRSQKCMPCYRNPCRIGKPCIVDVEPEDVLLELKSMERRVGRVAS